ncbi:hypothetical protein CPB85DRAFT_1293005 [Mucidula mucida]|nr:hypothetical protein CPB85DRAFT_1293005 [Mucidula mucida]
MSQTLLTRNSQGHSLGTEGSGGRNEKDICDESAPGVHRRRPETARERKVSQKQCAEGQDAFTTPSSPRNKTICTAASSKKAVHGLPIPKMRQCISAVARDSLTVAAAGAVPYLNERYCLTEMPPRAYAFQTTDQAAPSSRRAVECTPEHIRGRSARHEATRNRRQRNAR